MQPHFCLQLETLRKQTGAVYTLTGACWAPDENGAYSFVSVHAGTPAMKKIFEQENSAAFSKETMAAIAADATGQPDETR